MLNAQEQLARLKERIALVNARFASTPAARPGAVHAAPRAPHGLSPRCFVEQWSHGEVVRTNFGEHFETERLFPSHRRHGSADIGALADLPDDLFSNLINAEFDPVPFDRWAFLDTETTGLGGGSANSTYAFLIGVGRITREGFRVRQFFMREYKEERSILAALQSHLKNFDLLITYNGKTYDQPLLEGRYAMARQTCPFAELAHVDLLHSARRLWKLRLETCRLMQLEEQVLGFFRNGDLAGELIPYVYFEYLRSHEARTLVPIFHHNAMDILTLACLTAIVPAAFRSTDAESLAQIGVRRGEDLIGIARWLLATRQYPQALELFKRAIDLGLPDSLLFRALWDIASLEKKLGCPSASVHILTELVSCTNPYRVPALEQLAKHYEHDQGDLDLALDFTNKALAANPSPALLRRRIRLERRLSKPRPRRTKSLN